MKLKLVLITFMTCFNTLFAQVIYEEFDSYKLGEKRGIKIQLPRNYNSDDDKKYDMIELPEELKGLSTVTISRGGMRDPAPGFKFRISEDSAVYLAVHDRGGYKPPKGWKKTDMKLKWTRAETDTVYQK